MKKFLSIAIIMLIVTSAFLITSKNIIGDKKSAIDGLFEETEKRQDIEFVKYEQTEQEHQIYVSLKNNWNKIIHTGALQLRFTRTTSDTGFIDLPITGYEYYDYSKGYYESTMGIDPGETKIYVFKIPKEISFDTNVVNLNKFEVEGQVRDFMFRSGKNSLYGGFASWTCREILENTGEPIVIDNN